jgi:hypothetical protein
MGLCLFFSARGENWRMGKQLSNWKPVADFARTRSRGAVHALRMLGLILLSAAAAWGLSGGSLSGVIRDVSGSVVPGAALTLVNRSLQTEFKAVSDAQGHYSFPAVPVGRYDLTVEARGFQAEKKTGVAVDADAAVTLDLELQVEGTSSEITVSASAENVDTQPEKISTHLGEVVPAKQVEAIPLNGRSYTDLLAIQPGVSPVTTLTPTSVIMAGVTGTINPSGDANPGNVSIDGQRESANGFMVDGTDVQEHMNGGTSVIPNLDSIDEFRVLTNNFDPEYGNYNGGMINVITKSGSNAFHGDAFEFLRNTSLDAKNFFDTTRGAFRQNQFGGVLGGPVRKDKVFFFLDYQGTRTTQGITSPKTTVPSLQDRDGNLADLAGDLTGTVSGANVASLLTQKLGYTVSQKEPYYFIQGEPLPGATNPTQVYSSTCASNVQCVFPNLNIPQSAWSAPAQHLLQFIPLPNIGANQFSTSAFAETVRDDKAGARIDANTRWGTLSGYYFVDDYRLDNPYPGGQGGASVPGFDALSIGRAQEVTIGYTRVLNSSLVNEFHAGILRNANIIGQPHGGLGVSLQSQGFVTGPGTPGIVVQSPQYEGVENIVFPSFVMGVPVTNVDQWNNTLYLSDAISKVTGTHTLKFGGQFHADQVNEHPNGTFNGTFIINGTETGSAFADFLLGFPSNFTQSTGQGFYLRNKYGAAFAEDSWRARSDLTLNFGVRWDLIEPWSEKYNNLQTVVPGRQSVLYPNAIPGLLVPGDPGIPSTLSPSQLHNFAPRIGAAYSPNFQNGILKAIFGGAGKSGIRASFGQFYTAIPGLSAGIMYGVPPFGYNYLSPAPPLFATPFINASNGAQNTNPFPFTFPPHSVSAQSPFTSFNFAAVTPISAAPYYFYRNAVPYTESYMLSLQRQIAASALLTVSFSGNQGHHLLVMVPTNTGDPATCLALPGCGPFAENGARPGLGPKFGPVTAQETVANSNYNALEASLRLTPGNGSTVLIAYTYSKSIDQASNIGEQINPFNQSATRVISSWDMTHNFVATYNYEVPLDRWFHRNRWTQGWSLSGTTRLSTGLPVTLSDVSDNSLLGTLGNGVNNQLLDTPQMMAGPLQIHTNPRDGQSAFNASLFSVETLGQLGNAPRRFFHGPGIENFDMQISKTVRLSESRSLDFRMQAFNIFNHAQFYGPAAVNGQVNDTANFGHVVSAAAPRLIQLAMKFHF